MSDSPPLRFKLSELTYADVRDAGFNVAVLPLGATEPHNLHLPYATDTFEGDAIGEVVCRRATEAGARVVLLPTVPYGTETNMRHLPLAMNVNPSTLFAVITDLVESLSRSGIRRLLLLNSHGGNELKPLLRELAGRTDVHLFLCNWFRMVGDVYGEIFEVAEDHAGEMETSIALAYFPQLVRRESDGRLAADAGEVNPTRFAAVNQGWVSITRQWELLTSNTGSGNPHAAHETKGREVVQIIADRLAPFLVELGEAELDERFPF